MNNKGFTLIEIIVFLSVIAVAVVGIMSAYFTMVKNAPNAGQQIVAYGLAQARMEIIYSNRRLNGYPPTDPCTAVTPPAICTTGPTITGYSVTSTISAMSIGTDNNYSKIVVTATGPNATQIILSMINAKY